MRLSAFLPLALSPVLLSALAAAQGPTGAPAASCQPQWLPTFGQTPGTDGNVECMCTFDDGSGSALYAGGWFVHAGGVLSSCIAKWDGSHWTKLGAGLDRADPSGSNYHVLALCVFDDGTGPALYAAGDFSTSNGQPLHGIARWNGSQWSPLGSGLAWGAFAPQVHSLAVFDDGSGPALYAGGGFDTAGGLPASGIARWKSGAWSAVGGGVHLGAQSGSAFALSVFDDGSGPALYAGGMMDSAGGVAVSGIARWDGSSWAALASGVGYGTNTPVVRALSIFDDGSGAALFAGGSFSSAGGAPASHLARWNGSNWSALGGGTNGDVNALAVFDAGAGLELYAGGAFAVAGGTTARKFARWNGSHWSAAGDLYGGAVESIAVFDDGSGRALYAGGGFLDSSAGSQNLMCIAKRSGSTWSALGQGIRGITNALCAFDDGSGPALYAGGSITSIGTLPIQGLARWNGSQWSALGPFLGEPGFVGALCSYDDGSGPALYAGGTFTMAGGVPASRIAKWNGSIWSPLGSGLNQPAESLYVFDDGSGPALIAGGTFTHAGAVNVRSIAKWDGANWSALAGGLYGTVYAMCAFDDGSGPALYAGGSFTIPGAAVAENIAKWDGVNWTGLGGGVSAPSQASVSALTVFDDGSGPALYVGGLFSSAGTVPAVAIAKWNGTQWSSVGAGLELTPGWGGVGGLRVHDDGSGPALFASGYFEHSGTTRLPGIARWRGGQWSGVGGGIMQGPPESGGVLETFDDGTGTALYVGGRFGSCADSLDSNLAKWGVPASCVSPGVSICEPGSGGVSACPCANPPSGAGRGCDNSSASGGAQLTASGVARVSNDTLVLATSGATATATSVVLQGDALSASGVVFGQGVRCVAGSLMRLYVKTAVGGSITAPATGDPSISARSAALGSPITQGTYRYYGVYYRDPSVLGGCPSTSSFNITQQLSIRWQP